MTGHQQETAIFNAAMGQSFGSNLHNEVVYVLFVF
jgi:hypothetical protein